MSVLSMPARGRGRLLAALLLVGSPGALPLGADAAPLPAPAMAATDPATAADVERARDLFTRLVAREAAFDPTTKTELYADSAVFDYSLRYTDGTVAPIAMTIDDVRQAAAQSMALARQQGIVETYSDPVFTALGQGRVRVDCRVAFSDGGPDSTMSQVMGPDPASGRFVVLAETVQMVEVPESPPGNGAGNANGPAAAHAPAGPAT